MDSLSIFIIAILLIIWVVYITEPLLRYYKPEVITNVNSPFGFKHDNKLIYKNGIISSSNPHPVTKIDLNNVKTLFGLTLKEHEEANERIFGKEVIITAKDQEFILNATKKQTRQRRKLQASTGKQRTKKLKPKLTKTVKKTK